MPPPTVAAISAGTFPGPDLRKQRAAGMTCVLWGKETSSPTGWEMVMGTSHTDAGNRRGAPISELIRALFADLGVMIRGAAELAKIELKTKATKFGAAAAMLGAGALLALFALGTFVATAVLALAIVLPAWAAALIVGVLLVAAAAALAPAGRAQLRDAGPLAPTETIDNVREDIAWMRRETEQLHATE
jgi:uncharacterized membrane protein YqjE